MTEAEWLACDDVNRLLAWFGWGNHTSRSWRLLALACIEPIRSHLIDKRFSAAIEVIARDAEGDCEPHEIQVACDEADVALESLIEDANEQRWFYIHVAAARAVTHAAHPDYLEFTGGVADCCADALRLVAGFRTEDVVLYEANRRHVALLRDIFGSPFRPVALDPLWLTFDVQALARGIYDERAFDRMPILADALQDAGCENVDVLNHCRDPKATHVRGCWVLDLLLGKS